MIEGIRVYKLKKNEIEGNQEPPRGYGELKDFIPNKKWSQVLESVSFDSLHMWDEEKKEWIRLSPDGISYNCAVIGYYRKPNRSVHCPKDEGKDNHRGEFESLKIKSEFDSGKISKMDNFVDDYAEFDTQPACRSSPLGWTPRFEISNTIANEINEYLSLSSGKKEADIAGFKIKGHVDMEFMRKAIKTAEAICKVTIFRSDNTVRSGTGSIWQLKLKSPNKIIFALLTNRHVLPDVVSARNCEIHLDAYQSSDSTENTKVAYLDHSVFFFVGRNLDYSFTAIHEDSNVLLESRSFFEVKDIVSSASVERFEGLNLISFPRNSANMEFSIRGMNYLRAQNSQLATSNLTSIIRHGAFTLKGSSGALLFNDKWQPLGLHFEKGEFAQKNGKIQVVDERSPTGSSDYTKASPSPEDKDYDKLLCTCNLAIELRDIFTDIANIVDCEINC